MDNKITFMGNMLEVNKIEVNIKQFVDVIELGLNHVSLNDLYNELIGGYVLSGYKYDEATSYPLFDLRVNDELVPEFKKDFHFLSKKLDQQVFAKDSDKYYLIYVQELERCISSVDLDDPYDQSKLSMSYESISLEDGSEYKVVNPLYFDQGYETEISYTVKESYFGLKSDGRLVNLILNN